MMFKKLLSVVLCFVMLFALSACGGGDPTVEEVSNAVSGNSSSAPVPTSAINPLTGLANLDLGKENLRPVAVMINNLSTAQRVQTGVPAADILYETEVEGGITRLMAVYKDISAIKDIGTIRSARYAYIDLALGHDAVYAHCGIDPTYAKPYVKTSGVTDFDMNGGKYSPYSVRKSNGLASEHTLYSSGALLSKGISELGIRNTTTKTASWCSFTTDKKVPADGTANKVTVPFSTSYTSIFTYDAETGLYTKNSKNVTNKDYFTGDAYQFKNVFVLATSISSYSDNYHKKVSLTSGSGYYISEGGYEKITWEKGGANESFRFYAADGTELKVNAGNNYVCIHNQNNTITIQ